MPELKLDERTVEAKKNKRGRAVQWLEEGGAVVSDKIKKKLLSDTQTKKEENRMLVVFVMSNHETCSLRLTYP